MRQLTSGDNYRHVLRRVKLSEETNIILHCSIGVLAEVFKQAQQVGLMTDYHNFIITNPDLHTLDLEPYQYSETNITGIRLVDPEDARVEQIISSWRSRSRYFPEGKRSSVCKEVTGLFIKIIHCRVGSSKSKLNHRPGLRQCPLVCRSNTTDEWQSVFTATIAALRRKCDLEPRVQRG